MFTDKELEYIGSQLLGRIGTVNADGQPDVVPIGFNFDGEYFYIGGRSNEHTRKYKNVLEGRTQVGLAIDHLESKRPWVVMGIKIYGTADIVDYDGYAGKGSYLRIQPTKAHSWGIE